MNNVVLITGITGFLGCHIGQLLCENNYQVIATKQSKSNLKNCIEFQEKISWINIDDNKWQEKIIAWQPSTIIHAAWVGVNSLDRDNWELQSKNIVFLQGLLHIAKESNTNKFIGLGSQAEYGFIETVVAESQALKPTTAYGAVKIICSQIVKNDCILQNINWYWCRIFSVFGEKESPNWLIPSVIKTILSKKERQMAFSPGNQLYAYMYIKDLANAILNIVTNKNGNSGTYNISSSDPMPLKTIVTLIRDKINPNFELFFGSLPYRSNQSMLIAGDVTLFNKVFGNLRNTNFEESINNTISFYIKN